MTVAPPSHLHWLDAMGPLVGIRFTDDKGAAHVFAVPESALTIAEDAAINTWIRYAMTFAGGDSELARQIESARRAIMSVLLTKAVRTPLRDEQWVSRVVRMECTIAEECEPVKRVQ